MDDAKEALIGREKPRPSCQGVALKETLAGVFGKDLYHPPAPRVGELIPLKVSACVAEHCVELIADQLVR